MARIARGGSSERNLGQDLNRGSKTIWISGLTIAAVAAAGVGVGFHERNAHQASPPQTVNAPAAKPMRASPEALEVLTQLRNRYGSVSHQQTSSDPDTAESNSGLSQLASPLLPGLTDDFEANPAGILVRFPATNGTSDAKVVLPSHANAPFGLQAIGTGMRVQAQLEGVQSAAAEMADGYAVYRQALGPKTTVLRRAMPNGSEDFVSYAEAPNEPSISYRMTLDSSVAGLRLVSNTLELLDNSGTPRLRVAPPYIVSADGNWVEAKLALNGCAADFDPSDPSGRALTAPGSQSCQLRVTWDNDAVEYPALLDPTWMTTGSMATPRHGHTATLLSTGKVLVAGGTNGSTALATAELYDRTTGTWAATGSMTGARQWHTAVQLNTSSNPTTSGKVLIAGGRNGTTSLNTAQLYSPSAGTWVAATNLNVARQQHTATLLPSGKVLVTGGVNSTTLLATAATYDPSSIAGTWTATTGPMPSALKFHSANLLTTTNPQLNGKVLICGGNNGTASKNAVYLYDPAQLAFSTLANMPTAREGQSATILPSTRLLLAGGKNGTTTLNTAVLFDPGLGPGSWSTTGNMTAARQGHSASLLSNGQVLVAGGSNGSTALSSAELYNGTTAWTATAAMPAAVQGHTATALANGVVLIAGGLNGTTTQSASQLYDVTGGNTCTSGAQCQSGNCVSGVCCNTTCADQCSSCSLAGRVGICSPKTNGAACNDGNACTQSDTCQSGACTGSNPVTCSASDACHLAGTCNTSTGACTNPTAPDGTACTDDNVCTIGDKCSAGICHPDASIPVDDSNPCTTDSCDPTAGVKHVPQANDPWCAASYSAGLSVGVQTSSCDQNQVRQTMQVKNTSSVPIKLSDITIKFWVDDTTGSDVVPEVTAGGCTTTAATYPNCYHQVQVATAVATSFSGCSTDATHRASWEIVVTNTDSAVLQPGEIWTNLQISVHLGDNGAFKPGTAQWYSPCLISPNFQNDPHFAVYFQGQLDHSAAVAVPTCRTTRGPFDFIRSPFSINASKNFATGEDHPSEVTSSSPVDFVIPARVWVRSGNAGNGQLKLEYRNGSGPIDTCTYQGAASAAHPTTARDAALGLEYRFNNCVSGATKDQHVQATWVKVSIVSGDSSNEVSNLNVRFALGDGCSDILDPDLSPFEVTAMREDFTWNETKPLIMTDSNGRHALWHGMIYIDRKEQLAALDKLKIYWSAQPISVRHMESWNGRCGLVQHSSDGKGIVVYAIFPAMFFNIMRTFGMQAQNAKIDPPFKFIIPSTPDEPNYVNPDGTLSYEGLAATGYLQWLQSRGSSSPWFGSDIWNSVSSWTSTAVSDAWNWMKGAANDVGNGVETGIDYAASSFDAAIDWSANALDNAWESIQDALQEFVLLFSKTIHIKMDIRTVERDPMFNIENSSKFPFGRMWGPKDSSTYSGRPYGYPANASIRVRQWGWGFVPVMDETRISETGHAELEAVQGDKIRADGTCIELESNYAMMTSDLVPNEVCDFTVGDTGTHFNQDWSGEVWVDQKDVYTLTQFHDAYHYVKDVMFVTDPYRADVLIGGLANKATHPFDGQPQTLCLDFPGVGMSAIAAFLPVLGTLYEKDIWWPVYGSGYDSTNDSRGIAIHEYGHFTMCNLAYLQGGSTALRGMILRLEEGKADERDDERALMLETFADTFAMQVAGGSNYVNHTEGATYSLGKDKSAPMGWCTSSPCMDYNYAGNNEYSKDDPFNDEVARYEGIAYDAFDGADSSGWFSGNTPAPGGIVSNGDVWALQSSGSTGSYLHAATSPFIMNDDEPVRLHGKDWYNWVSRWQARGRDPYKQHVLGGLVDVIRQDAGYSWCDACEVLAPHYVTTPAPARMKKPDSATTRTMAIRTQRWDACTRDGEMSGLLGAAPSNHGNMLSSCAACPPLSHPDETGTTCVACPSGSVPRGIAGASDGTACEQCVGGVAGQDNECHDCGPRQIRVNNVCTDCPRAYGADKNTNTCVACPVDALVVAPCQQTPGCNGELEVPFVYAAKPDDVCPNEFWLEIYGLDTCQSPEMYVQVKSNASTADSCVNSTGGYSVYLYTWPREWQGDQIGQFTFSPAHCTSDGKYCFKDQCTNPDSLGTFELRGGNAVLVDATVTTNGNPAPGTVVISTPLCPQG